MGVSTTMRRMGNIAVQELGQKAVLNRKEMQYAQDSCRLTNSPKMKIVETGSWERNKLLRKTAAVIRELEETLDFVNCIPFSPRTVCYFLPINTMMQSVKIKLSCSQNQLTATQQERNEIMRHHQKDSKCLHMGAKKLKKGQANAPYL